MENKEFSRAEFLRDQQNGPSIEVKAEDWIEWAKSADIDQRVIDLITQHPDLLAAKTPRFWEIVSHLQQKLEMDKENKEFDAKEFLHREHRGPRIEINVWLKWASEFVLQPYVQTEADGEWFRIRILPRAKTIPPKVGAPPEFDQTLRGLPKMDWYCRKCHTVFSGRKSLSNCTICGSERIMEAKQEWYCLECKEVWSGPTDIKKCPFCDSKRITED